MTNTKFVAIKYINGYQCNAEAVSVRISRVQHWQTSNSTHFDYRRDLIWAIVLILTLTAAHSLAWAQDSPATDDSDAKPSSITFNGSGTFDATVVTPCSGDECYSIAGAVNKTSFSGLGTGDVTGDATLASCKIIKSSREECCTISSAQTYSFSDGDIDVIFGGVACGKAPTKVKAVSLKYQITGGTSLFDNASGKGTANFTLNEDTGEGTFNFKGKLTE
jgi:hypothetical protein